MKNFSRIVKKYVSKVAHIYWSVWTVCMAIIWPEGIPPDVFKASAVVGVFLSAYGFSNPKTNPETETKK